MADKKEDETKTREKIGENDPNVPEKRENKTNPEAGPEEKTPTATDGGEKPETRPDPEKLTEIIINMAIESWRFGAAYERLLDKIDSGEQGRHLSQYRWFVKKMEEALAKVELNLVTVVGREYDPGMPATPINIDEFGPEDALFVEQMLEPIIVGKNGLVRAGSVVLRKATK
ncbi:MAG: hypothetical protein LBF41_02850 [Deltaproteobacteria bacterium]|jgi:hypothetical protein|nr:hypothetical protein [Deltaproteobacteria bacterium]